jgi:FAD/FMN-containing dehydrogenase
MENPTSEEDVVALVRAARAAGRTLRPVGTGHSSSEILCTDSVLVRGELSGIRSSDATAKEVTVGANTTLKDLGSALLEMGFAIHNYGDVDVQTVAGAVATGTHGSGRQLQNLATMLIGARVVTGTGEIADYSIEMHSDILRALRVSLGTLGICTALRIRVLPAYELHRREWCTSADAALSHFDDLADRCRHLDFYWYPRSDEVKLRTLDEPGQLPDSLPYARRVDDQCGPASKILPRTRELRFEEMEYAVPASAGPNCFSEVRERMKARHRREVAWRVLYRLVRADDAYLSTAHGQDVATISLHHNAGLPFWDFFRDIEPIFRAHGGRPHWAKKHTLRAAELRPLYPQWDRFLDIRRRLDPDGVFLSPQLDALLGASA